MDLKNLMIVGAQHILPSTLLMLQSLFDRGLQCKNVFLIGKCYSTDINTYYSLKNLGVYVCNSSLVFEPSKSFDTTYENSIKLFTEHFLKNTTKEIKTLVLDDGGQLIQQLSTKKHDLYLTCIEQTTSGYEKIRQLDLDMGVINVARSRPKLDIESKIVVRTAIHAVRKKLLSITQPLNILILGNGAIGGALANGLEGSCNVSLADIKDEKSDKPYRYYMNNLHTFDVIIGCVGKQVLSKEQICLLNPGTTLISLSSSDREFDIVNERTFSAPHSHCHSDFECNNGVMVVNSGFPANFSGDTASVDIPEFELTRGLLISGIIQAYNLCGTKGIIPLSNHFEEEVTKYYIGKF